jgi:hypothetical protein
MGAVARVIRQLGLAGMDVSIIFVVTLFCLLTAGSVLSILGMWVSGSFISSISQIMFG